MTPTSSGGVEPVDALTAPLEVLAQPAAAAVPTTSVGKHARHAGPTPDPGAAASSVTGTPAAAALDDRQVEQMLAQLAMESGDPLVGVAGRFHSRGAKIGLAVGVCVAGIAVMFVGAVLLAAIFG